MSQYIFHHLAQLLHTGIFRMQKSKFISYEENPNYNPIFVNEKFRGQLMDKASYQKIPFILRDEYQVYFVCIKQADDFFFMGPFATQRMGRVERHRFYRFYQIEEIWEKGLHYYTFTEICHAVGLLAKFVTGQEYTEQELLEENILSKVIRQEEKREQIRFNIESDEEDFYRHTYQEEKKLLDMVRSGDVREAVRLNREMDAEIGRLGKDELSHWRNLLTISATLCARAAIEGGIMPYIAYRISGFYINKGSQSKDITQILTYRNHAVEELTMRVREHQEKKHMSNYVERCKDYVRKHYREKIYLEDIAKTLGISETYLSRLFKKETGIRFQDFVNEVRIERASNLLIYSEESLSGIAEYVNFPSQSYFGKIFKAKKQMTPRQYRETYKPAEFYDLTHNISDSHENNDKSK